MWRMSEVYLVVITTGEWEDVREAILGAFLTRSEADAFVARVEDELGAMRLSKRTASFASRWYGDFEVAHTGASVGLDGPIPLAPAFTSRRKRWAP
jgi:hypothetical protein